MPIIEESINTRSTQIIGLGLMGLGGFGQFALQQYVQVPGIRLVGIAGTTQPEALHSIDRFDAKLYDSFESLLESADVDWVYLNTPPFLHASQAESALKAGKHVLVEKPLAIKLGDGERLVQLAKAHKRRLVTNLMQRYNPIVTAVHRLCNEDIIGDPLYFSFNNHAVDEGLGSDHWFWDPAKSGGIFIEHGVHFFDLARYWFGDDGMVLSAGGQKRLSDGAQDQVWCDVKFHPPGRSPVISRFYHGFNQSSRTESQTWEIVFERGTVQMSGWIPVEMSVSSVCNEVNTRRLAEILPGARLHVVESIPKHSRQVRGHGKAFQAYEKVRLDYQVGISKSELYGDLLYRLLKEQTASAQDESLPRRLNENDGLQSLRIACDATQLAAESGR